MLEQDKSTSLVLAATNHAEILDRALLRRFDDVLYYHLPDVRQAQELLQQRLAGHLPPRAKWKSILPCTEGLSYAEIAKAADDALKMSLIDGAAHVEHGQIIAMLRERHQMHAAFGKP